MQKRKAEAVHRAARRLRGLIEKLCEGQDCDHCPFIATICLDADTVADSVLRWIELIEQKKR